MAFNPLFGAVNTVPAGNVYPTAGGATLGQIAGAGVPVSNGGNRMAGAATAGAVPGGSKAETAASGGVLGQPFTWWGILAVLLVALMWAAKRAGQGSDFGNIKLSAYNVLTITLAAMVGFGIFKALFGVVRVRGLSEYVAAV